jgi:hypothetical protein
MDVTATAAMNARAAARFADLLATVPAEPVPVRGMSWTSHELGAHVLSLFRGYAGAVASGTPLWPTTDGVDGNQRLLDATPERLPADIVPALALEGARMRDLLRSTDGPVGLFGDHAASAAVSTMWSRNPTEASAP